MKLLKIVLYISIAIILLVFGGNIIITTLAILFEKDILRLGYFSGDAIPVPIKILQTLKLVCFTLFVVALIILFRMIYFLSIKKYFSNQVYKSLNFSGRLFLVSGVINFILSFIPFVLLKLDYMVIKYLKYFNYDSVLFYLSLVFIGLFFILFNNIIKEGSFLKQENDLTI